MIRSTLQPCIQPLRALPPCDEPLRSLWDPDAEPADAFVAWLERKLARYRDAARRPHVTGAGAPSTMPTVPEEIEVVPFR